MGDSGSVADRIATTRITKQAALWVFHACGRFPSLVLSLKYIVYSRRFLPSSRLPNLASPLPVPMSLPTIGSLWTLLSVSSYASTAQFGVLSLGQLT